MLSSDKPSELILNPDGSVYHLHLHPEQVSDTIITVGDPDRVQMVSRYFDRIEFKNHKREFVTHTGYIGNKRITCISTGIGTDNIDIVLNELHLVTNFDLKKNQPLTTFTKLKIYRIGTSGSLHADVPVDSLLISDFGVGIDNLLHFYKFTNSIEEIKLLEQFKLHHYFHHTIHPYVFTGSAVLIERFKKSGFLHGITLSCPGFYGPQGRNIILPISQEKFYDDLKSFTFEHYRITNFEMETAALYGLSTLMGHECISLNALLANRSTGEFSTDPEKTVDALINKSLETIISS